MGLYEGAVAARFDAMPPVAEIRSAPAVRRRDTACVFERAKAKYRLALYLGLLLLDCATITVVHALFGAGGGAIVDRYLAIELLLFVPIAARLQGYTLAALRHPREGALRAAIAAATAPIVVVLLAAAFDRSDVVPFAFARETVASVACLFLGRRIAGAALGRAIGDRFTNDLVLVDGRPSLPFDGRTVMRASDVGLDPSKPTPEMLNRIGHFLKNCDRVVIDAPHHRRPLWLAALRGIDVEVELIAGELNAHRPFELRTLDGNFTLLIRRGALPPGSRLRKRAFDIVVAGLALVVLLPVMAALALAVRASSPGPALFRQWRVGRGNRQFQVLKFRTMRSGAIDLLGHRSSSRNDPRITALGHFMRRTSLDELPQLINVLVGDMSIVGPRPHALGSRAGEQLFWNVDADYWDRHAVKPGMTGLAQVRGLRGATATASDLTMRLRSDIEYISNWSLMSDVFILLRTVRVLVHRNAY